MDSLFSISALQEAAAAGRTRARVHAQVASTTRKETKDGKPFWEVALADALGKLTLRAWSDAPAFPQCANLQTNAFLEVRGEFSLGNFGLESRDWQCRELSPEERQQLLAGPPEQHARLAADFSFLETSVASMAEPRLQALCTVFLKEFRERLLRTGAARGNHHARRGGLVEHTAQMLRSALALAAVYPPSIAISSSRACSFTTAANCGKTATWPMASPCPSRNWASSSATSPSAWSS